MLTVPLLMAYITRYIFGTDKLRPNAFEVRGMNGSNTGVIHINDLAVLSHWIKLISDYITGLTNHKGNNKIWANNFYPNGNFTGKSMLEALIFSEHGENMLC